MRRWPLRVLCWLALGAAANVAVAWGLANRENVRPIETRHRRASEWPEAVYTRTNWPPPTGGISDAECRGASYRFATASPLVDTLGHWSMSIEMYGWPVRSVRQVVTVEMPNVGVRAVQTGYECIRSPLNLPALAAAGWSRYLPIHPLWPGFALNTLFYAVPIGLLWLAPGTIRRSYRRRHHLCIHCSYPVGDPAKPCSECGKFQSSRPPSPR